VTPTDSRDYRAHLTVTVAALLGHEKLETTAIYTQPSDRAPTPAVEQLQSEVNTGGAGNREGIRPTSDALYPCLDLTRAHGFMVTSHAEMSFVE